MSSQPTSARTTQRGLAGLSAWCREALLSCISSSADWTRFGGGGGGKGISGAVPVPFLSPPLTTNPTSDLLLSCPPTSPPRSSLDYVARHMNSYSEQRRRGSRSEVEWFVRSFVRLRGNFTCFVCLPPAEAEKGEAPTEAVSYLLTYLPTYTSLPVGSHYRKGRGEGGDKTMSAEEGCIGGGGAWNKPQRQAAKQARKQTR